ncbi:MAG: hypothetical protein ACRD0K_30585, partial [Egibacteraceae bacterium]
KIWGVGVERLLDDRDYAALNDKQLFETVELCHHSTQDVEQTATPADSGSVSTPAANPAVSGETRPGAACLAKETPTKRREVIQLGGVAVAAYVLELLDVEPDRMHAALDAGTVSEQRLAYLEQVADRLGVQVIQVARIAPPALLPEAVAHFRSVRRLVADRQRTLHQVRLSRAGAKLAIVVGQILFIEGLFDLARGWYRVAQDAALDAGDRYLADVALASSAYLPTYTGDPSGVLALVGPRLEQRCRPTPATAWLWSFKGKAHAALGQRAAFERAMGQAHTVLDDSPAELIGPGIFSFLPEKLEFYTATGWVELRDADRATQAADQALITCDLTDNALPTLIRLDKASALAQSGEVPQACDVATGALLDPSTYNSVGIMIRAREFDALLGDDRASAVRDWREVLTTIRRQQDHRI